MSSAKRKGKSSCTTSTGMNFQRGINDNITKENAKGTRPTTPPETVTEALMQVVLYICKKGIFFNLNLRIAIWLGALFLVSLIGDFASFPKTFLSRSDNIFNQYFVKVGWGWTLFLVTPFLSLTSLTICCGDRKRLFWNHITRILIATAGWFLWTKFFNIIEASYGRCNYKGFNSKSACLKGGHFWNGFDISGHAFILIYSSLILIEEARPIIGWEFIREHIRNENHDRLIQERSSTPLKSLGNDDLKNLKELYDKYTPIIRLFFVGMTLLQLLWDFMLIGTMMYYHKMIEKVAGGMLAILMWFFTYRIWYASNQYLPDPAGKGLFNYSQSTAKVDAVPLKRKSSFTAPSGKFVPNFKNMPFAYRSSTFGENNTPNRVA